MNRTESHVIYTIGHSTHTIDNFIDMLKSFKIGILVDIRRFPGSRKYPQFNSEALKEVLERNSIKYIHLEGLGGRRKVQPDSDNNRWRNDSFRGYADYMETKGFKEAVTMLENIASKQITAIMCSEAVWWRCHRAMVSDYLKAGKWDVRHIMAIGKDVEHSYTSPAIVVGDRVYYSDKYLIK